MNQMILARILLILVMFLFLLLGGCSFPMCNCGLTNTPCHVGFVAAAEMRKEQCVGKPPEHEVVNTGPAYGMCLKGTTLCW